MSSERPPDDSTPDAAPPADGAPRPDDRARGAIACHAASARAMRPTSSADPPSPPSGEPADAGERIRLPRRRPELNVESDRDHPRREAGLAVRAPRRARERRLRARRGRGHVPRDARARRRRARSPESLLALDPQGVMVGAPISSEDAEQQRLLEGRRRSPSSRPTRSRRARTRRTRSCSCWSPPARARSRTRSRSPSRSAALLADRDLLVPPDDPRVPERRRRVHRRARQPGRRRRG